MLIFCVFLSVIKKDAMMKITNILKRFCLGVCGIVMLFLSSCESDDHVEPISERTILFYFAADCNLNSYIQEDVREILKGMVGVKGRVVIYMDAANYVPVLMTVKQKGGACVLDTIDTYAEENSVSPTVLGRVTRRVRELYPAESYGLVLGSHGSGWIPTNSSFARSNAEEQALEMNTITRYFGEDKNIGTDEYQVSGVNVSDLVTALPTGYEFIAFDVCLMSNVELLYALRYKSKYILASAAEILLDGFPYEQVMPLLWGGEEDLKKVCQAYRDFYESGKSVTRNKWGMLTLVRTAYMDDFARQTKAILSGKMDEVTEMDATKVWRYPLIDYKNDVFFDFGNFVQQWASESQYADFVQLLEQMVYTVSTQKFAHVDITKDKCCGISTYIPLKRWNSVNEGYNTLEWTQYVYGE